MSIGDSTTPEGGVASLAVTLNQPAATDVTFDATVGGGTAINGYKMPVGSTFDYKTNPVHHLTIKAGKLKAYVQLPTFTDTLTEPDETFNVTLSNAVGANIRRDTGTGTITDASGYGPGTLLFGKATIVEVDPCASPCIPKVVAKVPVVLIPPSDNTLTVTVDYQTQDAGATAGVDYIAKVGKTAPLHLTFLPGRATHKFVTVIVLGDSTVEPTEGIDFVFSNPQNASFGNGSTGHVDILDNDS